MITVLNTIIKQAENNVTVSTQANILIRRLHVRVRRPFHHYIQEANEVER